MVNSFSDVIVALGGVAKFAAAVGMKPNTAKMAKARNSISPIWWPAIIDAANSAGRDDITSELLIALAAERRAA